MSTIHNEAKKGEIAKVVLMSGDPLRAKYIAENFLEDYKLVNKVRNMLAYTGFYKGKRVSVMGSGMGIPSMGIYVHELYDYYDVDVVIRIGSCGAFQKELNLYDIVLAQSCSSDSNFAHELNIPGFLSLTANYSLLSNANDIAKKSNINVHVGNILSSDLFYHTDKDSYIKWANLGVLAVEMETYALYLKAAQFNKKALSILTVSDSLVTKLETTSKERETKFNQMAMLALEVAIKYD